MKGNGSSSGSWQVIMCCGYGRGGHSRITSEQLKPDAQREAIAAWKAAAAAAVTATAAARASFAYSQTCPVEYSSEGRPLLFGGVSSRCVSGCQSRAAVQPNDWGNVCSFDPAKNVWGICTEQQAKNSFELAKKLGGGSILQLSPCDLVPFLRGRTLWLLGPSAVAAWAERCGCLGELWYNVQQQQQQQQNRKWLQLSPCDLVPFLRGRTLWLLGDSHTKTLYRALQCFLFDFWNQKECKISTDPQDVADIAKQPAQEGVSNCFHLTGSGGGRICIISVALTSSLVNNTAVAGGGILPLLRQRLAKPEDIFYINTGTWHRKTPQWASEYKPDLEALGKYYQETRNEWPHMLFRETPAVHPADTARNVCLPLDGYNYDPSSGMLSLASTVNTSDSIGMWANSYGLNKVVRETLPQFGLYTVPAYNMTPPLVDNHVAMRNSAALDCLHYCQPGMPEAWVWYLYNAMRESRAGIRPLPLTISESSLAAAVPKSSSSSSASIKTRDSSALRTAAPASQAKKSLLQQQQPLGQGQYACTPSTIRLSSSSSSANIKGRDSSALRKAAPASQTKKSLLQQQQALGQGQYACTPSTIRL
uniref:Uncharacterized protein n=1 Tax=Tetradesmus obliquus TaxID=3088 RepID=A0A383VEI9_TETOB